MLIATGSVENALEFIPNICHLSFLYILLGVDYYFKCFYSHRVVFWFLLQ